MGACRVRREREGWASWLIWEGGVGVFLFLFFFFFYEKQKLFKDYFKAQF